MLIPDDNLIIDEPTELYTELDPFATHAPVFDGNCNQGNLQSKKKHFPWEALEGAGENMIFRIMF